MIVKPFENKYDVEIYNCIKEDERYKKLSEGEKAVLYDIVHEVKKFMRVDFSTTDIDNFVHKCYVGYSKNKNVITLQVVANCISTCFPNKLVKLENNSTDGSKKLIIIDKYTQ